VKETLPKGHLINNRYEIIEPLGEGASAVVYQALDYNTNKLVTLKLFSLEDIHSGSIAEKLRFFHRESTLLERISHPNIVRIIENGIYKLTQPFLIMEFTPGITLDHIIESETLNIERIINILNQIAYGLDEIHSKGIIHRDINPKNILIDNSQKDEKVKLLDFGIAKLTRESDEDYLQTITSTSAIVGTVYYMSPEQCGNKELNHRTDIYSLGITIYEMLAGSPPFHQHSPIMVANGHLRLSPPALENVSQNIEKVVFKALEKDPQQRFSSALEFAQAFELAYKQNILNIDDKSSKVKEDNSQNRIKSLWQNLIDWKNTSSETK